jgi:Leucine-rich repeat (LRR) protein
VAHSLLVYVCLDAVLGLSKCSQLTALFLQKNQIGSAATDSEGLAVASASSASAQAATTGLDVLPITLQTLNVSNNRLTDADVRALRRLAQLKALIATHNALTALPPMLSTNLNSLSIAHSPSFHSPPLPCLSHTLMALRFVCPLSVLSSNALASLDGLQRLTQLTKLSLSHNRLTELPASIGALSALCELRVNGNRLQALPPAVALLTRLKLIDLGHNQIKSLEYGPALCAAAVRCCCALLKEGRKGVVMSLSRFVVWWWWWWWRAEM